MNALATAPGVISPAGKYYISANEVMEYLGCKENKAYELIRQLRDELVEAGKLTPAYPTGKVPRKYFFERCLDPNEKCDCESTQEREKEQSRAYYRKYLRMDGRGGQMAFAFDGQKGGAVGA